MPNSLVSLRISKAMVCHHDTVSSYPWTWQISSPLRFFCVIFAGIGLLALSISTTKGRTGDTRSMFKIGIGEADESTLAFLGLDMWRK
jgi:hypothetical protein